MARQYRDCVLLLGDSLRCGQEVPDSLISRFNAAYVRTLDVVNRGIFGYNTAWYLPAMDRMLAKVGAEDTATEVRLVTIWLGTNDALCPVNAPGRGISLEDFEANMRVIFDRLTSPNSPYAIAQSKIPLSIILITPPFVLEPLMAQPPILNNDRMKLFRDVVLRLGSEWKAREEGERWKIGTIDWFGVLDDEIARTGEPETLYTDGVHLSTKGFGLLWDEIDKLVHTEFKGRGIDWKDEADLRQTVPAAWDLVGVDDAVTVIEDWLDHKEGQKGEL